MQVEGGLQKMIIYKRLWALMKEKGVSQYALIHTYNISPGQITRLKRDESVSTHTIDMFCRILDCNVEDIMEHITDESEKSKRSCNKDKADLGARENT